MQGIHLTADLFDCKAARDLMIDRGVLQEACIRLVRRSGLTVVGDDFHQFADFNEQPGGVTGLVLLAESHLAVHTWPELDAVTLDVYVCNFTSDNTSKAQMLTDELVRLFAPERANRNSLLRGVPQSPDSPDPAHLAIEWLTPDVVHGFARRRPPRVVETGLQRLEWHDTRALGRMFSLDGAFMASERDEFIYHECMVHVPALAHNAPRHALVMGGGDGCSARELLRYAGIERIIVAELDPEVIDTCRREFADVNRRALDDPRVEVRIGDAFEALRKPRVNDPRFDLVVMDLTDPGGADSESGSHASALYSRETYELIRSRLTPGGLVTLHIGSAFHHPDRFRRTLSDLRDVFRHVAAYKAYMPLYGCEWGLAVASMSHDPGTLSAADIKARLAQHHIEGLRFYSPRVHASLFAWPLYAEALGA